MSLLRLPLSTVPGLPASQSTHGSARRGSPGVSSADPDLAVEGRRDLLQVLEFLPQLQPGWMLGKIC